MSLQNNSKNWKNKTEHLIKYYQNITKYLVVVLVIIPFCLKAQDSLQVKAAISSDTLDSDNTIAWKPSPKKASIYSTVLPGMGQAYNRKYWKIPVIYTGFGLTYYFFHLNNTEYKRHKQALIYRTDGDSTTIDEFEMENKIADTEDIENRMNYYRKNRDLMVVCMALVYILNIVDASVDAHLYDFDVSDELSMRIEPKIYADAHKNNIFGAKLTLNF